jgi:hypothetical protein
MVMCQEPRDLTLTSLSHHHHYQIIPKCVRIELFPTIPLRSIKERGVRTLKRNVNVCATQFAF